MRSLVMFIDDQAFRPVLLNSTLPGNYLDNLRFTSPFVQSLCRPFKCHPFCVHKPLPVNDLEKNQGNINRLASIESATEPVDFCQRDRQRGASCTVCLPLTKQYFPYSHLRRLKFPLRSCFSEIFLMRLGWRNLAAQLRVSSSPKLLVFSAVELGFH